MSNGIKFKLARSDDTEVQPLWFVLAVIRKHGFRTVCPVVRSGLAGSFLLATLVYVGSLAERVEAFPRICEELGEECTATELIPA
jgi:hypothetical protein